MRILLLADTHLGFDDPLRPRVIRRRRGPDFFRNFRLALDPACRREVDLVVHAGDILYRSRVPARLVDMAFDPLRAVAGLGVPVYVVPGNHERSTIPFRILAAHPNIHIFDEPKTFYLEKEGLRLALAGFPFVRTGIRKRFRQIVASTGYHRDTDYRILCMHQSVDGCVMGPHDFVMRGGDDVVDPREIPPDVNCVLSGHMHRSQVLGTDHVPIIYPGSIERTSFAEKDETKGYIIMEIWRDRREATPSITWTFQELPTRPMIRLEYDCAVHHAFAQWLHRELSGLPEDSIVKIDIRGVPDLQHREELRAASLRAAAPDTMNVQVTMPDHQKCRRRGCAPARR